MDYTPTKFNRIILITLAGLAGSKGQNYCFPSQTRILALLEQFHGTVMSRATLNRHLRALVQQDLLTRHRRHKRGPSGQLELHSTVYSFTARARRWLSTLTNALWGKAVDKVRGWLLSGCLNNEKMLFGLVDDCLSSKRKGQAGGASPPLLAVLSRGLATA